MADYTIKQNDTGPYIDVTLEDANGAVDVSAAESVKMHMELVGGGTKITGVVMDFGPSSGVAPTDGSDGKLHHQWQDAVGETPAELSVPGEYNVEFEVHAGGRRTTFPEEGYKTVKVETEIA